MKNFKFSISFVFTMLATMYSVHSKSVYNTGHCTEGDINCYDDIKKDFSFCTNHAHDVYEAIVCKGNQLDSYAVFNVLCAAGFGCGQYTAGFGKCLEYEDCEDLCKRHMNDILSQYRDILAIRNRKTGELVVKSKGWPAGCILDSYTLGPSGYYNYK